MDSQDESRRGPGRGRGAQFLESMQVTARAATSKLPSRRKLGSHTEPGDRSTKPAARPGQISIAAVNVPELLKVDSRDDATWAGSTPDVSRFADIRPM